MPIWSNTVIGPIATYLYMPTICGIPTRVETRLGYLSHVLSGSSGCDPVYKISGSDLDSALDHMRAYLKSTELLYS